MEKSKNNRKLKEFKGNWKHNFKDNGKSCKQIYKIFRNLSYLDRKTAEAYKEPWIEWGLAIGIYNKI